MTNCSFTYSLWTISIFLFFCAFANDAPITTPQSTPSQEPIQKHTRQAQMIAGYNAPCRIDIRESWDLFTAVSFLYWQMSQDNMEIAFADTLSAETYLSHNQLKGNVVAMDFAFLPGFKVAIGVDTDQDGWDAKVEYTMLHGTSSAETNGIVTNSDTNEIGPLFPTWGNFTIEGSNAYNSASEHWRCNLDTIDTLLSRRYCVGKALMFRTSFGARAAWILQNVHLHYTNETLPHFTLGMLDVYERSHCWSLGPRILFNTDWVIGQSFRCFGNAGGDLLYTKYKLQTKSNFLRGETTIQEEIGSTQFIIGREIVSALRTHLDMDLGFGWGSYFGNHNWYVDLSASYTFQVFFNQMVPKFYGSLLTPGQQFIAPGNLYAQGLTATIRLDF